jgi:hypothetical protein
VRCRSAADRGSVTAEFAIALPAVVLVLAGCLSAMQVAGQQLRLQDAAALAARSAARGDGTGVAARLVPASTVSRWTDGDLECVTLSAPGLLGLELSATSCALGGGR